jgi:hypothetical protein
MDLTIANTLYENNIFNSVSKVRAKFRVPNLGAIGYVIVEGDFRVKSIIKKNEKYEFKLTYEDDGRMVTTTEENIITLDGMDPIRMANSYSFDEDGNEIPKSKRGRPRKIRD